MKCGSKLEICSGVKILGWYSNINLGKQVSLEKNSILLAGRKSLLSIGDNTSISFGTTINAGFGKITIGEKTMITGNCYIISSDHDINDNPSVRDSNHIVKDVEIGDNVWIRANCVITKGSIIGEGATIGAGPVVNSNIPEYSIAVGSPAKVIKKRNTNL